MSEELKCPNCNHDIGADCHTKLDRYERKCHCTYQARDVAEILVRNLQSERDALRSKLEDYKQFHPRAIKLLDKRKNFLVVADDEPYFIDVYGVIRGHAITEDKWTIEDEERYQQALQKLEE